VFSIVSDESAAYVNFLQISHGSIIRSHTMERRNWRKQMLIIRIGIIELRERFQLLSREVVPFPVDLGEHLKVTVPQLEIKANFRSFCPKC
jgi:excinuclease ABC subunit C